MRIAAVIRDKCQNKRCNRECFKFCPLLRTGVECITEGEKGKPIISETLCAGCGICVNKCPFDAVRIVGLADELKTEIIHQYGKNAFRLYRLPFPKKGIVTGILGPNGIGKSTAINILSGLEIPNLGKYDSTAKEKILQYYAGTEMHDYFQALYGGKIRTAIKPQYVDKIPMQIKGVVKDLLSNMQERMNIEEAAKEFELEGVLDRELTKLSGGELQRLAIAATMMKDVDVYFFDEPSSYLDIYQRVKIAKKIKKLSETKQVIVIEHDLAILDFLADNINIVYGIEGVYGVFTQSRQTRTAINVYLDGYLPEENIRFRDKPIEFFATSPQRNWNTSNLIEFSDIGKSVGTFSLKVNSGIIKIGESIGIVGPNGTGKTTFVKIIAGEIEADAGKISSNLSISYKPQYIAVDFDGTVKDLLYLKAFDVIETTFFQTEVIKPLNIKCLYEKNVKNLSGGELQRVAIAICLSRKADIYLIDEPSAYLDSNQRMTAAKIIRRMIEKSGRSGMIIDHDMYFLDMVSDSMMVFGGIPGHNGSGSGPYAMREGMNKFLSATNITFRRDAESNRPRINKPGSRLDREQKLMGEYYYTGSTT